MADHLTKTTGQRPVKTLSLFTGAGGLDIGFHLAGYDILACVEIEPAYCRTLEANIGEGRLFSPSTQVLCKDIREFDPTPFKTAGIECVIGGPPCQTFSAAGRRSGGVLGTADSRGRLFRTYCQVLLDIQPQVFVFENVYGLPGANGGHAWQEIVFAFESLGYQLRAEVIDTADYGVPQHRERLIMVGYKSGDFKFPMPTHGPDSVTGRPLVTVLDAIRDLQDPEEPYHDELGGLYGHLLALVPEGLNYAFFTREMGYPEPIFAWRSKFHDLLYKVDKNSPCRTIKAHPGKFTGPFHWKNRHFTIQELKRLQTFPDDYELTGSFGKAVEQIGNSVPPQLAEVIAISVREQLLDESDDLTLLPRPLGFRSTFRQRQRERTRIYKRKAEAEIANRFQQRQASSTLSKRTLREYWVQYEGFFQKIVADEALAVRPGTSLYHITVDALDSRLSVNVAPLHPLEGGLRPVIIEISGLRKYLASLDLVRVSAMIQQTDDLFAVWDTIEDLLTGDSAFLTLIDIYGHYANRGDTVKVCTTFPESPANQMERAVQFFGRSENCGISVGRESIESVLSSKGRILEDIIGSLRSARFDVRTKRTHPTLGVDQILCTYPFPLLSAKAHLQRRLSIDETDDVYPRRQDSKQEVLTMYDVRVRL